ncbi:fungal-specific transcription factor domain-containing protein [Echria macrotheca]|uniref:Fungal-specific transcription factor domain-containing protein n=1 Tax=Echria macrotheca TaxID=438768 RepID=A0AAJ0B8N6_9PEZI|nr:fungal-specific transcription factor domain-containing protein [Echria macrotheca]
MDPMAKPAGDNADPAQSAPDLSTREQKKRNRIRFSCTHCREKKLKCNRHSPCDQCEKRNISGSCRIIPYETRAANTGASAAERTVATTTGGSVSTRSRPPLSDMALQNRLKHLEHLVQVLKSQRRDAPEVSQDPDNLPPEFVRYTEKAALRPDDHTYVDSAHWESVLDDITTLTRDLATHDHDDSADLWVNFEEDASVVQGPFLLLGGFPRASVEELVALLPPRAVVDRMIARFFEAREPAWVMFHVPTFMKTYKLFWDNPLDTNYSWIALLLVMCCHAALYFHLAGEETPGNLGDAQTVFDEFRIRTAQALTLADYTKPGPHKVQAMTLYFGTEYLRRNDSMLGTSTLLTITIRLAMHSGLHRDPKHYPTMTPFEGEMRRRMWLMLREIDLIVSFQFGMPTNIARSSYDTQPPRNLHDIDFDEDTKELPASRPETERTVTLVPLVRGRMLDIFDDITEAISVQRPASYAEIMRIDERLNEEHNNLPETFKYRPFSQSLVDPVELIMQRYWFELVYQKSRAVLHRKYHCLSRKDPRFFYSRRTCIDAATHILKHQYDIYAEMQLGGRLAKDRWFMNSFSVHDFLLASMILCLELAFLRARDKRPEASEIALREFEKDTSPDVLSAAQITEILGTSRLIWRATRRQSAQANRAFKILSKMLALSTGDEAGNSPESNGSSEKVDWSMAPPFHFGADAGFGFASSSSSDTSGVHHNMSSTSGTSFGWTPPTNTDQAKEPLPSSWTFDVPVMNMGDLPTFDDLDIMVDPSLSDTWSLWDNQIQDPTAESSQVPWESFFPSR